MNPLSPSRHPHDQASKFFGYWPKRDQIYPSIGQSGRKAQGAPLLAAARPPPLDDGNWVRESIIPSSLSPLWTASAPSLLLTPLLRHRKLLPMHAYIAHGLAA